jgi:hypothetical protein
MKVITQIHAQTYQVSRHNKWLLPLKFKLYDRLNGSLRTLGMDRRSTRPSSLFYTSLRTHKEGFLSGRHNLDEKDMCPLCGTGSPTPYLTTDTV